MQESWLDAETNEVRPQQRRNDVLLLDERDIRTAQDSLMKKSETAELKAGETVIRKRAELKHLQG